MMKVKKVIEIITRETIKPSTPTPHHQKCFNLSFLDQLAPAVYSPLVLFYADIDGDGSSSNSTKISQRLKESLSETLIHFYPLAGRIKDNFSIDCNDEGAEYVEGRVNCCLSDILGQLEAEALHLFLPHIESNEAALHPLLVVQATFFECGGMAIGVRISHKLSDAATLSTFISAWVASATESWTERLIPEFNAASLFPPRDSSITVPTITLTKTKCMTRRYVFTASKIASLKALAASTGMLPTRVEVVSALIWKCAVKAWRSNNKALRVSLMSQSVNIRKRIVPPLPESSVGNIVGSFVIKKGASDEIELQDLVGQLRKGLAEFSDNYVKKLQGVDGFSSTCEHLEETVNRGGKREGVEFFGFTSWCRFPFYEADFGWGKPIWVGIPSSAFKNFAVLMDTRDGKGIEAWVFLSEEDMALFECDQELLSFATLNPSALNKEFGS